MKNAVLIPALFFLFTLTFLLSCSKKESIETIDARELIGEWILVSEYNDDDLEEIKRFPCNNFVCNKLIFNNKGFQFEQVYEDFSEKLEGEYIVENDHIVFIGQNESHFLNGCVYIQIHSSLSDEGEKLILTNLNGEHPRSWILYSNRQALP